MLVVEIPALGLAAWTWIDPEPAHWMGWYTTGALRLLTSVPFFFIPWVYFTPANPNTYTYNPLIFQPVWPFFVFVIALMTMIGILPLRSTFIEEEGC
jgi:hypothetical protein